MFVVKNDMFKPPIGWAPETQSPCDEDIPLIKPTFKESIVEMQESAFLPRRINASPSVFDAACRAIAGARHGKGPQKNSVWFVPNTSKPGKYLTLDA